MLTEVNTIRNEKIEFRRDAKLLVRPKPFIEEGFEIREKEFLSRSAEKLRPQQEELI